MLLEYGHIRKAVYFEAMVFLVWTFYGVVLLGSALTYPVAAIMALVIVRNIYRWGDTKDRITSLSQSHAFKKEADELVEDINKDPADIFLGKGFVWETKHIQNYHDLLQLPERRKFLDLETKSGGYEFMHALSRTDKDIYMHRDKLQHTLIAGTTGTGKTKFFELLINQLCATEPTVIVDPKGDKDLLDAVYDSCVDHNIEDRFVFFSLAHPSRSVGFNPLSSYGGPSDVADRIASIMPGGSGDQAFRNFAWQVIEVVASAMMGAQETITLDKLQHYGMDDMNELVDLCEKKLPGLPADVKRYAEKSLERLKIQAGHPKEHFQKMITSLGPVLTSLNTGDISPLLNAEPERSIQWNDVLKNNKIVYFDLSSMLRQEVSNNVGKMVVQDLLYFVGEIYAFEQSRKSMNLFVDEFYSVMFRGYIDMLNKSRGAGLRMFLGMQTTADIANALGDGKESYVRQVLGNINNKIYLRVPEPQLAKEFSELFGNTYVKQYEETQSETSRSAFANALFASSRSFKTKVTEAEVVSPDMLMHLPIGQAFGFLQARDPYKLRLPLIARPPERQNKFSDMVMRADTGRISIEGIVSLAETDGSAIEWPEERINV